MAVIYITEDAVPDGPLPIGTTVVPGTRQTADGRTLQPLMDLRDYPMMVYGSPSAEDLAAAGWYLPTADEYNKIMDYRRAVAAANSGGGGLFGGFFGGLGNFLEDIGGGLVDGIEDVGDAVTDVIEPVGEAVGNVVEGVGDAITSIVEDPKKLALVALSIYAPGVGSSLGSALGLSGTAASIVGNTIINTALNGGDVKSALVMAAIPVVGQEAASGLADKFVAEGFDKAVSETAGKIVSQTGIAAATGRDPVQALISGGVQEALPAVTSQIDGFNDLSPRVQRAVNRAVATSLLGGDPSTSLVNSAILAGRDALASEQKIESQRQAQFDLQNTAFDNYLTGLGGQPAPPDYGVQDLGITPENWDSFQKNLLEMQEEGRLPTQWRTNEDNTFTYLDDDGSTLTIGPDGNIISSTPAPAGNLLTDTTASNTPGTNLSGGLSFVGSTPSVTNQNTGLSSLTADANSPENLLPKFFETQDPWLKTTDTSLNIAPYGLQPLQQLSDTLSPDMSNQEDSSEDVSQANTLEDSAAQPATDYMNMFSDGGSVFDELDPDLLDILTTRMPYYADGGDVNAFTNMLEVANSLSPSLVRQNPMFFKVQGQNKPHQLQPLKQLSQVEKLSQRMAKGGLPTKYEEAAPKGHHPEFITGLTGYYAGGRGTGQSDDIPAMLHDGDYVIDAEAVSALGDGSSKAGKEVLTRFMHQIPHQDKQSGSPVAAKIADGEFVLPESFVTALGGGDNKQGSKLLDEMRESLREHKRSAPLSKIPPKAKTPLEYLEGVKG